MGASSDIGSAVLATNPVTAVPMAAGRMAGIDTSLPGLQDMVGRAGTSLGINGLTRPQLANVQQATSPEQVQQAQQGVVNSLASQQALLAALQGQNGLGMQNTAGNNQLGLANQLQGAGGVGVQTGAVSGLQNVANQQQNTANMYQDIAQGRGPNPAQAMLNQQTGVNAQNQAALMAGQRGAGANTGLVARQAAQQGAAAQQQAVGQGATMQANQQLGALSGLNAAQQAQAGTQQAIGGLGGNLTGQQMGANQAYANQANQIAGQQIGQTNAGAQAALSNQQQMQGALQGINNSNVAAQGSVNAANAGIAQQQVAGQQGIIGGIFNGAGAMAGLAGGGEVKKMAAGGDPGPAIAAPVAPPVQAPVAVPVVAQPVAAPPPPGPTSTFGRFLTGIGGGSGDEDSPMFNMGSGSGPQAINEGLTNIGQGIHDRMQQKPGKKPPTTGEEWAGADTSGMGTGTMAAAKGGLASAGGHVKAKTPAQKPEQKGNSLKNDKVPAMLSEGEIVIPRSVAMGPNPSKGAADFVAKVLAKRRAK